MHSPILSVTLTASYGTPTTGCSPRSLRTVSLAWLSDTALLIYIALATVVIHLILGNRYGIHRDELATLEDARHLAWGYTAYPPVTPFFGRLSLELFGTSIRGFRFFANVAQAIAVVLTGLMARDMGARRGAQLVAAVAAVPFCLGGGYQMMYVAFDCIAWTLTAYFVVKLLRTEDPRWWVGIGAGIGFGMMTKYTMGFFALSIVAGVLLTPARRYLRSKWLWIGVALSILIWLPNVLWQAQHNFVSLDFLSHIHARDVRQGRTSDFLPMQFMLTGLRFPLALAGLYFCFSRAGKRFRMIGWMYVVTLALFTIAKGRWYYMGPAYPMLYAAGAVWGEQWLATMQPRPRHDDSLGRVGRPRLRTRLHHRLLAARTAAELPLVEHQQLAHRRLPRATRLARTGAGSRAHPRLAHSRRTRAPRHHRHQLRRSRSHQSLRPGVRPAPRHQRRELVLVLRLRRPAAANRHHPRPQPQIHGRKLLILSSR